LGAARGAARATRCFQSAMCAFSLLLPKKKLFSDAAGARGGWKSALELRPEAKNIYQAGGAADN